MMKDIREAAPQYKHLSVLGDADFNYFNLPKPEPPMARWQVANGIQQGITTCFNERRSRSADYTAQLAHKARRPRRCRLAEQIRRWAPTGAADSARMFSYCYFYRKAPSIFVDVLGGFSRQSRSYWVDKI